MGRYGIWLSFNDNKEGFQLPVNPGSIEISDGGKGATYDVSKLGEVNIIKDKELTEYTFDSFFPAQPSPYIATNKLLAPKEYVSFLEKWMGSNKPIRFIFTGTSFDINTHASIESFEWRETAGSGGDIEYTLGLKKYVFYAAQKVKVKIQIAQPPKVTKSAKKRADTKPSPKVYRLVSGDSLWKVAKKFLGNPLRWPEIQKLNNIKTSQLRRLPIGLPVKIPPK